MKKLAILGAGGFAREVEYLVRELNQVRPEYDFLGFLVSDVSLLRETDSRSQVLGDLGWLAENRVDALAFGIGNPQAKLRIAAELATKFPDVEWPSLIHPTAQFDFESAKIGRGVVVCAGCVGSVNMTLDDFSMINKGCMIGHEAYIGKWAVVNAAANISGGVILEDGVLVGTGASVLQYRRIGANAVVGSGAVVVKDVDPAITVFGNPARRIFKDAAE